eukprot:gnl/TRDRNA2_/TRDRNA2_133876_c4_seq2.p1 gnl/TRDRNA2_/TRDRNA2_133876_c4~~gnl/TRDRNA2_/TRDRNA2_133876_c4_seq2.p1  ORF type:complete len:141 (+),score=18.82 gnl/TRDRNA2_/TRDRNA2_133876_c4_seq2:310-732(+)
MLGRRGADLRKGGAVSTPSRLRFTRRGRNSLRFENAGSYLEAVEQLDRALAKLISEESSRRAWSPGQLSFVALALAGWQLPSRSPPPARSPPPPSRPSRRRPDTGGAPSMWICKGCGHVNGASIEFCEKCNPDGENEEDD